MFDEMRIRFDASMRVWGTFQYIKSDVECEIKKYSNDDSDFAREMLAQSKATKEAIEAVEETLVKFVKQ